jgi:putative Mn2+ efflux pump MntP
VIRTGLISQAQKRREYLMPGTMTFFITLIPMLIGLGIGIYLISLLYRLVVAVERIAERTDRV